LSLVNLYFMTPCLLFTKMASAISWKLFVAFWPIPVLYVFFSLINWTVAIAGSKLLRFSKAETRFVTGGIMFCNNNSLPIALIQSLAFSAAKTTLLRDENDTSEEIVSRGISYILLYNVFDNLVRWSYGINLLANHPGDSNSPHVKSIARSIRHDAVSHSSREVHVIVDTEHAVARDMNSFAHESTSRSLHVDPEQQMSTGLKRLALHIWTKIRPLMIPPLLTAILALFVGLIPSLQKLLFDHDSRVYTFVVRPLESCGQAAIPLILLCLGAQVVSFGSPPPRCLRWLKPQVFILVGRMVLMPLVSLPLVLFCPPSLSPVLTEDPTFRLTLVILMSSPTAINLIQICTINDFMEKEMAEVLFWTYCVAGIPCVLVWAIVALWAASWK
ncbi:auxin efflux carrier, partial [Dissophora ornata]